MDKTTRRQVLIGVTAAVFKRAHAATSDEFALMDGTTQAELVRKGKISSVELVDAAIRRIEKLNPQLNAVIWERFERARQEARSNPPNGPFMGVPFLTKDLGCTIEGEPESQGSQFLKNHRYVAQVTTELARRIRAAGFINLGRTNAPEFGMITTTEPLAWGPTRNPWDITRTPGGSSGGSAAAVAALMTPIAHGTDAGGSIRVPAAACGLVGLKSTRGRISSDPGDEITSPLAVQGFLTRSVRDLAGCLDFAAGRVPGDPAAPPAPSRPYIEELSAKRRGLRIGLLNRLPHSVEGKLDPVCKQAVEDAGKLLESLGHHVELAYPPGIDDQQLTVTYRRMLATRCLNRLRSFERRFGEAAKEGEVEPGSNSFMDIARGMSATDYLQDLDKTNTFTRQFAGWWRDGFDLLLTPATATAAPRLGTLGLDAARQADTLCWSAFVRFFNFSGQPAISLPLFWSPNELPIGIQLGAAFGREDLLITVAAQLEKAHPWEKRLPVVHA